MARTSKNIEYIKDKSGKAYIKANSIAADGNESLQDVLNKEKLYMVSGSIVKGVNSDSVIVHTWAQIQEMFENLYGFTPDMQIYLGISFTNGDGAAHTQHVEGAVWLGTDLYCTWNGAKTGTIRINYAYFYNH